MIALEEELAGLGLDLAMVAEVRNQWPEALAASDLERFRWFTSVAADLGGHAGLGPEGCRLALEGLALVRTIVMLPPLLRRRLREADLTAPWITARIDQAHATADDVWRLGR